MTTFTEQAAGPLGGINAVLIAAQAEVDRLTKDNAALRQQVAALQKPANIGIPTDSRDVGVFDAAQLVALPTADYTIKAGEQLKLKSLSGKNIICRLAAGQEAWIVDCDLYGGYAGQWITKADGSRVKAGEKYCVDAIGNLGTLYLVNCRIHGAANACVYGDGIVLVGSDVFDSGGDLVKAQNNVVIDRCLLRDGGMNDAGAHADGVQTNNGKNVRIKRTRIHLVAGTRNGRTYKATQGCIFATTTPGTSTGLLIEDSLFHVDNGSAACGVLAWTGTADGSSVKILNTIIEAQIPLNLQPGATVEGVTPTQLPKA